MCGGVGSIPHGLQMYVPVHAEDGARVHMEILQQAYVCSLLFPAGVRLKS